MDSDIKTKKMLVEYSLKLGNEKGFLEGVKKDFIFPVYEKENLTFVTLPKFKIISYGFVVFVGKQLNSHDIMEKLKKEKTKDMFFNIDLNTINDYIYKIKNQKIGDVVKLFTNENNDIIIQKQNLKKIDRKLP